MTNVLNENNCPNSFLYDCLKRPTSTDCSSPEDDSAVKGFAIVLYIQGIAESIRRVFNNCGIKVALIPFRTFGHIFVKPKNRVPTDRNTHAVYPIPCGDCEKVYLGQTKRQFCTLYRQRLFLEAWHISMQAFVFRDDRSFYHKNIYILLVDDVTLTVYKA